MSSYQRVLSPITQAAERSGIWYMPGLIERLWGTSDLR